MWLRPSATKVNNNVDNGYPCLSPHQHCISFHEAPFTNTFVFADLSYNKLETHANAWNYLEVSILSKVEIVLLHYSKYILK